jgi:hypothetical protein
MKRQIIDMIDNDLALVAQRRKIFGWLTDTIGGLIIPLF